MTARLILGSLIWILTCSLTVTLAGQPDHPKKLPAPETVVCPVVEGQVEVSWDLVEGGQGYQVEYLGLSAQTAAIQESVFVFGPPVEIELAPFGAVVSRVRALPGPKHPGNPPQSGGPKGEWSEACIVTLEVTPLPTEP